MDQRKRIDKILDAVEKKIQDEVALLLGSEFTLFGGERQLLSKEEIFSGLQGKQICAHLDITGDHTGKGVLLVGIKDAIRLGGTLIMLPDLELQEVVGREEYREELEDSYGEIANIVAGSITKAFEEMYPKPCRFIRKEQEVLVPAKVNTEADSPIANLRHYQSLFSMILDGKQMGDMVLLIPAQAFELEASSQQQTGAVPEDPRPGSVAAESAVTTTPEVDTKSPLDAPSAVAKSVDKPQVDFDKQKKKIDKLLDECQKRLGAEVGGLLSVGIRLEKLDHSLVDKEQFFADKAVGKQILAHMEVAGETDESCYFCIGIKDAIHLGGTLIMLPPSELTNVINEEEFAEDTEDAYGEVANIVSGVYTAVFEEQYPQKLRFIKKGISKVVPAKVVKVSAEPIADTTYYCQSMQLAVADKYLGEVHMLFPAALLQLQQDALPAGQEEVVQAPPPGTTSMVTKGVPTPPAPDVVKRTIKMEAPAKKEAEKHQKLVDKLMVSCRDQVAAEVSALLGTEVTLSNQRNFVTTKENFFFEEVSGKQVVTHLEVAGEAEGKSYLVVGLRDAIRVGGVLIMLPSQELESVVADEIFSDDTADSYGEIANIITGVYTSVFEEQYNKRIRFIKKDVEQVVPMKVDIVSSSPFDDGSYYLSSSELNIGATTCGKINLVFPLALLNLEGLLAAEEEQVIETAVPSDHLNSHFKGGKSPDILLVGDDEVEAAKIAAVLESRGHIVKRLSFKDNVHNFLPGQLRAVYLVMREVNEQAFGAAIKISAACPLPLIAAGPGWTRSKVIKAVRYGVRDILLTPTTPADIEENLGNNLLKLAA
jgi:chemotaxis protein CheY-P-specific phosphatase CheC